jgi:hypothetical protein
MASPAPHASTPIWKITDGVLDDSIRKKAIKTGSLYKPEHFWRHLQPWLATQGYMLRPRYHPDWQPSWGTKVFNDWEQYEKFEDGLYTLVCLHRSFPFASLTGRCSRRP